MNYITHRFTLDVNKTAAQLSLACKLNDTAIQLRIKLTDNGKPYKITDECTALFTATKPDGTALYNYCIIENNTIVYTFTDQTVSCKGRMDVEIRLSGEEGVITSPSFILIVDDPVLNEYDVLSSSEATALVGLVGQTNIAISEANAAAAAARAAVNGVEETAKWLSEQVGREIEMRYDPETGYLQYRLNGDTEWVDIASMDNDVFSNKVDKVIGAAAGNLAALTADGGLADRGVNVAGIIAQALAAGIKVETGTYTGTKDTNNGGQSNGVTLTFNGKPLLVYVRSIGAATGVILTDTSYVAANALFMRDTYNHILYDVGECSVCILKPEEMEWGDNSVSWWSEGFSSGASPRGSTRLLNSTTYVYAYLAITE